MNTSVLGEQQILLWPHGAPHAAGSEALDQPAMTVHLPDPSIATGCGIVVCPGGGYRILASDHEGLQVARALNRIGIAAFVLRYRVGPAYSTDVSLLDGQRAIRLVRHRSAAFGIDRVGMLGFSAGGHLTVAVGTHHDDDAADGDDHVDVDAQSSRPDFLIPVYAVTNGSVLGRKADEYTAADTRVDGSTPPTFLVHTHEDRIVPPEQSIIFYNALLAAGVQAEMHIYGFGEHGVGLGIGDPDVATWFDAMRRWMTRNGFLTSKSRVEVSGTLRIAQAVPGMAWVTLVPNDPNAPTARVKFNRDTDGAFDIPESCGPTEGPHTCVVHHISEQFPHVATGGYTLDDAVRYEVEVVVKQGEAIEINL